MTSSTRRGFLKGATATIGSSALATAASADTPGTGGKLTVLSGQQDIEVHTTLNGHKLVLTCAPLSSLADALRTAGHTGTKVACEGGACGACTVLVDGVPTNSCLALALDVEGKDLQTIEGLGDAEHLHPLQQAFIDADALQCGFCTPGMLMSAAAFYDGWQKKGGGRPSRDDVVDAMSGNLCRCGAHPAIIEAVQSACAGTKAQPVGGKLPGHAHRRTDAVEKVTGKAQYAVDVQRDGMLFAAMLRAPVGHADVESLDVDGVKKMPGVKDVVVLLPQKADGAYGKVRWAGQEIAAVCATSQAQADAALAAFKLKLKELPVVTDVKSARSEDAPTVWSAPDSQTVPVAAEGMPAPDFLFSWEGNVRGPPSWPLRSGSDEAQVATKEASIKTALDVTTANQVHIPLETHGCVAHHDGDTLTVWATTQTVHILASELADTFELPRTKVRVIAPYVGGGFGCKAGLRPEHIAAVKLSMATKAPVRLFYTWQDQLTVGGNRPGTSQHIRLAAQADGKLTHVVHHSDNLCGAAIGESSTGLTGRHYDIDEKDVADSSVVTHAAPACPWRAPGFPPNAFALEQAVDDIAVQLDMDPLQMRIDHEPRRRARGLYRLAKERAGYGAQLKRHGGGSGRFQRGVGVATGEWFVLSAPNCRVRLKATHDGHVEVATATHDMGQGARSVLQGVVADMLGLAHNRISVVVGDSDLPMAPGSFGSISTPSIAPAAMHAAEHLQQALFAAARRDMPGARLTSAGVVDKQGTLHRFDSLFALLPEDPFVVEGVRGADKDGFVIPPKIFDAFADDIPFALAKDTPMSTHIAEVEVDTLRGTVDVKRVVSTLDAGRIASPQTAQSQVIGAVMQGISYALYEERRLCPRTGGMLSSNLDHYGILGVADAPDVEVHFYEAESENNPYGSIGLGENSIVAVAASVANAIFRATGRRMMHTPMTPPRVLAALTASPSSNSTSTKEG